MSNREKEYRFDVNAPNINRPLAFPELARGRTFAQPFNIKVKPLQPRRQGIESFNRAQMALRIGRLCGCFCCPHNIAHSCLVTGFGIGAAKVVWLAKERAYEER